MITPAKAKAILIARGWSQRRAADYIRCHQVQIAYALNGHRNSPWLLERIEHIPHSKVAYSRTGWACKKFRRTAA